MNMVQIRTTWIGSGTMMDAFRPAIMRDYPTIQCCEDITGTPAREISAGNTTHVVKIICDNQTLNAILAGPNYGPEAIVK